MRSKFRGGEVVRNSPKILFFTFISSLVLFSSGCGNPFGLGDNHHSHADIGHLAATPTPYRLPLAPGSEVVSSSAQFTPTVKKVFLIQASIANMNGGIRAKSSERKIIYSSVQGNLISGASK